MDQATAESLEKLGRDALNLISKEFQNSTERRSRLNHPSMLANIVARNLASGRWDRVRSHRRAHGEEPSSLTSYVAIVARYYYQEAERVGRLRAGESDAWWQLYRQLVGRAYHILQDEPAVTGRAFEEAQYFAQATCLAIFCSLDSFPYDVAFDFWTARMLRNHITRRLHRSPEARDQAAASLTEDTSTSATGKKRLLVEILDNPAAEAEFRSVENQSALLQAIEALRSPAQREVIIYSYLEERDDGEIARRLGKSVRAVHSLRHRALRRLRNLVRL